jgi:ubiquinone/menaquinone biosynthesis C-methylase UbiE
VTSVDPQLYYETLTRLLHELFGHDWHLGYWVNASTPAEAAERLNEVMVARLPKKSGMQVLDIGCGIGGPACFIAERTDAHVIGVTNSRSGAAEAEGLARDRGLHDRVRFQVAEAADLPFDDASFDAIWSSEAIHNLENKVPAIRELARVLRPGGTVVLGDLFLRTPPTESSLASLKQFSFHLTTADDLIAMLQLVGISVSESIDVGHHIGPKSPAMCADTCRAKAARTPEHTLERIILDRTVQATSLLAEMFSRQEIGWGIWTGRKIEST